MVLIDIVTDPPGGNVVWDGLVRGTAPVMIEVGTIVDFKEDCLSSGSVSCNWDTLKYWLETGIVGSNWWDLTFDERHSIAHMATSNVMKFMIDHFKRDAGCGFGESEHVGECSSNTAIRFAKFDHLVGCLPESELCHWKKDGDDVWHNYADGDSYNIPCFFASTGDHVMAAIALNEIIISLDDLFIFQYNEVDIQPGCLQLPYSKTLTVIRPDEMSCTGVTIGTTVATIDIRSPIMDEFREECLSDGSVSCDWPTLEGWLISAKVGEMWWDLTDDERYSIVDTAVRGWAGTIGAITEIRSGDVDCIGGIGVWRTAKCLPNAIIRYAKFGKHRTELESCYYMDGIEHCYHEKPSYQLPTFIVSCGTPSGNPSGKTYGHTLATVQIGEDVTSSSSWYIFQYRSTSPGGHTEDEDFDIQFGGQHLPINRYDEMFIVIGAPIEITQCSGYTSNTITQWTFIDGIEV